MVAPSTDYGLPDGQVYPTTLLDSLYPFYALQGNTALQLALAQYSGADRQAQINAQLQGDAMRANAGVAAAGIGAGASAYSAQVGALAQLAATNADAATRVIIASGGDKNAANRLAAELLMQAGLANQATNMQASLANQATTMELGRRAGSGDLRENFGRMLALAGQGSMPGVFSAMNGLPSPFVSATQVSAPGVNYSDYGSAPQASMSMPSYSQGAIPQFSAPNVSVPNMDLGALYGSLFNGLGGLAGTGLGSAPTSSANPTQTQTMGPITYNDPTAVSAMQGLQAGGSVQDAQNILNQLAGLPPLTPTGQQAGTLGSPQPVYGMASGGTLRPGEWAMVGEKGPELRHKDMYGNDQIIPIRQMAIGGTIPSGIVAGDEWWNRTPEPGLPKDTPGQTQTMGPITYNDTPAPAPVAPTGWQGPTAVSMYKDFMSNMSAGKVPTWGGGFATPLARDQAARTEAEAILDAPPPTPTPTDIAASTTQSYDAGLPGTSAPLQPGQLTPGGPLLTDLPFYKNLMSGQAGPAWNANIQRPTAPELGINEGVPLPFERSNVYQRSDPIQRQAMSQLWSFLGIPQAMQDFWLTRSTPGWRGNTQAALGF